jgi:hypothetical protein
MVPIDTFRKLALSFPEATEEPHFEKTSFRVKRKFSPPMMPPTTGLVSNYRKLIRMFLLRQTAPSFTPYLTNGANKAGH